MNALRLSSPEARPFDAFRVYQTSFRGNLEQLNARSTRAGPGPQSHGIIERPNIWIEDGAVLRAELGISRAPRASTRYSATLGSIKRLKQKREMERADQAVLARQRPSAPHTVPGRVMEHASGSLPLWGFLSAFGGSWDEKGHGGSGSHAQNGECRCPFDPDAGEVRSGESGPACMASPPQRLRQQSLWTMFRGQGTVVCGIAWTRGLKNSMACFYSENRVG